MLYLPEELPFIGLLSIIRLLLSSLAHLKEALMVVNRYPRLISLAFPYLISYMFLCPLALTARISYKIKMSKYKKPVELSIPESYELGFCTVGKLS